MEKCVRAHRAAAAAAAGAAGGARRDPGRDSGDTSLGARGEGSWGGERELFGYSERERGVRSGDVALCRSHSGH